MPTLRVALSLAVLAAVCTAPGLLVAALLPFSEGGWLSALAVAAGCTLAAGAVSRIGWRTPLWAGS